MRTITIGVTLERGGYSSNTQPKSGTLVFDAPASQVSLVAEPRFVNPEGDYSPFVDFSDGGLALFTGQFDLMPVADADAAAAHPLLQPVEDRKAGEAVDLLYHGPRVCGGLEHTN